MKRLKETLLIIMIGVAIVFMSACGKSREDVTKELLSQKYGEEFIVHSIRSEGSIYYATCSPISDSNLFFETSVISDKNLIDEDNYVENCIAKRINVLLEEDLEQFFPGAYIHTKIKVWPIKGVTDVKNASLEELIGSINSSGHIHLAYVDIYVDEKIGTNKMYHEEYLYFEDIIRNKVPQDQMLPLAVSIFKVDSETINRLNDYYSKNLGKKDNYFENSVLGVNEYSIGIINRESKGLGTPPNIVAGFNYDFIDDEEEYIWKREQLENAK